jgi:nucleotide-binding universal stress UspA family protein
MKEQPIQVVVAYDFSPSAEEALKRALDVALRAPQHVLHVVVALDHERYDKVDHIRQLVIDQISTILADRKPASEVEFFVHTRIGRPAGEILDLAKEIGADLIFIGCHGKVGFERLLLGSTSERVVREARCPVMVVRPKTYEHVELMHVVPYEHEHHQYQGPHRYTYVEDRVIMRPDAWPIP